MRNPSLAGALTMVSLLAACGKAEPRGTQYFAAHLDEAREVVAGCSNGSVRGDECTNADLAVQEADAKERFRKFRGK
ncbi:EexN family lipoprotein [Sphingobium sp. Sx8-8]|uniref:EexN family lipoprotein n=1 Tax=Sphingobium sp. Sx8-8 TaxID=2933617 RepID=UPI001F592540|nr:EexN family lipoprotein [Sphingobium sp. Sx8-8]